MIPWTSDIITELKSDEIFVFGSNEQGFHGAGAAGLAMRGDSRNNWREDKDFLDLLHDWKTTGKPQQGHWAMLGIPRGFQTGRLGRSYAIATVTRPGARRSISRRDIYFQLVELWREITTFRLLTFYIPPLGEGYAGYAPKEMAEVWEFLVSKHGLPANARFIGRKTEITSPFRTVLHEDQT